MSTIPASSPKSNSVAVLAIRQAFPDSTSASSLAAAQKMVRSWPAYAQLTEEEQTEMEWLVAIRCDKRHRQR